MSSVILRSDEQSHEDLLKDALKTRAKKIIARDTLTNEIDTANNKFIIPMNSKFSVYDVNPMLTKAAQSKLKVK